MQGNWDYALKTILGHEGGNDDDPHDPGGRTSRGILQSEYDKWRAKNSLSPRDVWTADQSEIEAIYKENYWVPLHCDELESGVDLVVFDSGVNSGISRAAKWLQAAIGSPVDGIIGPATISDAKKINSSDTIDRMLDARLSMLRGLKTWQYYGKGWSSRISDVRKKGLALAGAKSDATIAATFKTQPKTSIKPATAAIGATVVAATATHSPAITWGWETYTFIAIGLIIVIGAISFKRG